VIDARVSSVGGRGGAETISSTTAYSWQIFGSSKKHASVGREQIVLVAVPSESKHGS